MAEQSGGLTVFSAEGGFSAKWPVPNGLAVVPAEEEPEEPVTGAEAGPGLATEGDLKLLAGEQLLNEEAPAAAKDTGEGGEEVGHPRQDRQSPQHRV